MYNYNAKLERLAVNRLLDESGQENHLLNWEAEQKNHH